MFFFYLVLFDILSDIEINPCMFGEAHFERTMRNNRGFETIHAP